MNDEESSQSAELNSYHRDMDPSFGASLGGFVITHQSPLVHQPAEGSLYDPAARQDCEAGGGVGAFDDFDGQLGTKCFDPLGEALTSVAAIDPQNAQPGEPAQHPAQNDLCPIAFGGAGRGHSHTQHQPQGINQQMSLAAFDPLAGVIANTAAVPRGFYALTVQDRCRWPASLAVISPNEGAQCVVERGPLVVAYPLPEDMVNRFPSGKVPGQITPRTATLDEIQDGIEDAPSINGWTSAFGRFREHWFEVSPLGIRETGLVYGDFHAQRKLRLKSATKPQAGCQYILQLFLRTPSNAAVNRNAHP